MVQSTSRNNQQLFKILVAAAWLDGEIQEQERSYLQKVANERNLSQDSEIQQLLSAQDPVDSEQCYEWLNEYLGDRPTPQVYQNLLAEIAGLVYADGDIAEAEAKLLTQLQNLDPENPNAKSLFEPMLKLVRQLYRKHLR